MTATRALGCGDFSIDIAKREIFRGGDRLDLPAKVFDCVAYLVEHRDRAVGRDELIAAVWGRVDISDNLLAQIVLRARRAFDDSADEQRFIRTIAGFGYRWVHECAEPARRAADLRLASPRALAVEPAALVASSATTRAQAPWRRRAVALAVAALVLVAIAALALKWPTGHGAKSVAGADTLAMVLPTVVHDEPDYTWTRLGIMDLIAQRLREAGQATAPSDSVVAIAKFAVYVPAPDELDAAAEATGAALFLQSEIRRSDGRWKVSLRSVIHLHRTLAYFSRNSP